MPSPRGQRVLAQFVREVGPGAVMETVPVRCLSGQLLTRVRRPLGWVGDEAEPALVELVCDKCRQILRKEVFHGIDRRGIIVLHYVHPGTAAVTETRIILNPQPGSTALNRGGSLVAYDVLVTAVAAHFEN
jgi:hypothetical protein